jgi:hypothetical protein
MLAAPRPEPARPARNRIPATTGAARGADRGGQRGQAAAQHLLAGDLGVPERRALFGVPVHRSQQRVDVHERPLSDAVEHGRPIGQGEQVP